AAAAPAAAALRLVDMHDARQVGRQRLPPGPDARLARGCGPGSHAKPRCLDAPGRCFRDHHPGVLG
ncbi:MAG: hypothetical protein ACOYMG_13705, partial [Candidatus Methylumidiphilus sp.]